MSHDIFIENEGQENEIVHFVYAKDVIYQPWHNLCHRDGPFESQFSIYDGFERLGGFREVTLRDVFYKKLTGDGFVWFPSEKGRAVIDQDGREFAMVGPAYTPVQEETFAKIIHTALPTERRVRTLGRLDYGKRIFAGCDAGDVSIKDPSGSGYVKSINNKLVFDTSHDSTSCLVKRLTSVDPVCKNTLTLGASVASAVVSLRHTKNVEVFALQVAKDLAETGVLVHAFESVIERLMLLQDVTDEDLYAFSKILFPHEPSDTGLPGHASLPQHIQDKRRSLCDAYYSSPGCPDMPPNGFRLYSAATWTNDNVLRDKDWAKTTFQPAAQDFRDRAIKGILDMLAQVEA